MKDVIPDQFLARPDVTRTQYGAVCWRMRGGAVEILLVTSRDTGRWIIPKGWPVPDSTPQAAAALEAWEEAGVRGRVAEGCIGLYGYDKALAADRVVPCMVAVYAMEVTGLRDRFPERKERRRKWFTPAKAAQKVLEPELGALLAQFTVPATGPGDAASHAGTGD